MSIKSDRRYDARHDIFEAITEAPWQFGVVFTAFLFSVFRWMIPFFLSGDPNLDPICNVISKVAPLTMVFLVPTAIAYWHQRNLSPPTPAKEASNTPARNDDDVEPQE